MRTPLLALAAVALLTACGPKPTANAPTASGIPQPTASVAVTAQGFRPLAVGQETGVGCVATTPCAVRFTVTAIDINPACDAARSPAPAGRKTVVLQVTETTASMTDTQAGIARLVFSPLSLKAIGADGTVSNVEPGHCLDRDDHLNRDMLPNSTFKGTVELAVAESTTSIASTSGYLDDGTRGWVWPIG
jgi:hypothetical protein